MTNNDPTCIFCRIANGELGTPFVAETENVIAFNDLEPKAPTHILIIPKRHVSGAQELTADDADLIAELVLVSQRIARDQGIDQSGYRLLTNVGPDAGQTVFHLHWHLLGGKPLGDLVQS